MNAKSIIIKTEPFLDFVCENCFDFIGVTETWLSTNDQAAKAAIWFPAFVLIALVLIGFQQAMKARRT